MSVRILDPHLVLSLAQRGTVSRVEPLSINATVVGHDANPIYETRVRVRLDVLLAEQDARALMAWFTRASEARTPERFGRDEEGGR